MKAAIICFSQTGNTRKVADKIREGILKSAQQCDLLPMREVDVTALNSYDLIGLGCPAFYLKEPFNVTDLMESLPQQDNRHWFVFCSHGAVMGQTLYAMAECLEKRGAAILGFHHTYADITVPFYPRHTLTSGHPDEQDLLEAFEFGRKIIECSRAVSSGDTSCVCKPSPAPEQWAIKDAETLSRELMPRIMPRFSINMETCTQCGQCEAECPVDGIDIHAEPIRIQNPCIYCLHCASICPTCSIEADWDPLVKMAPANYARYTQALNDAEKRGEFRWLVDPDSVDCSYPLYRERIDKLK